MQSNFFIHLYIVALLTLNSSNAFGTPLFLVCLITLFLYPIICVILFIRTPLCVFSIIILTQGVLFLYLLSHMYCNSIKK